MLASRTDKISALYDKEWNHRTALSVPVMRHPTNVLHLSVASVLKKSLDLLTHRNKKNCAKIAMTVVTASSRRGMDLEKHNEDTTELDAHRPTVN